MNYAEFRKRYHWNAKTDKLGEGGFGKVYRATDALRNRPVVIKIADVPIDHKFSLQREVELNRDLATHPNIAQYRNCYRLEDEYGEEKDYATMDYFSEGSLITVLKKHDLTLADKQDIIWGILRGLAHLERENVIHRDFKSANVLMTHTEEGRWTPKIADFGLSRFNSSEATETNSSVGISYDYAAPEQFRGGSINQQADLWAAGVMIYQILTGDLPFSVSADLSGESRRRELIRRIEQAELPVELNQVKEPYQRIIRRCLVKELTDRVKSANELLALIYAPPLQKGYDKPIVQAKVVPAQVAATPQVTDATPVEVDKPDDAGSIELDEAPESFYQSPKRSSNVLATVALALASLLIGVFGIIIWQKFFDIKSEIRQSGKQNGQPPKAQVPPDSTQPKLDIATSTNNSANEDIPNSYGLPVSGATNESTPTYDVVQRVSSQISIAKDKATRLFGLRKNNGQWPAAPIYSKISSFQNGFAEVTTDKGPEKYISKEGGKYKAVGEFTNGFAKVVDMDGKESYFSKDGKKYKEASPFTDGVTRLIDMDGKTSYLSKGGNLFDEAKPVSNGKVAVRKGKLWGYLNIQGEVSIRVQYTTAEPFREDGTAEVTSNGKKYRIDKQGKPVKEGEAAN